MAERHDIAGRTFLEIEDSTIEQDLAFQALVKEAGLDSLELRPGQSPESFASELLDGLVRSRTSLKMLGCLLIPADKVPLQRRRINPGEAWTPEVAEETTRFLGACMDPRDKARIRNLILSLLLGFFGSGADSSPTSMTSSRRAAPVTSPSLTGMAPGPS